jgi:hypothetical protein
MAKKSRSHRPARVAHKGPPLAGLSTHPHVRASFIYCILIGIFFFEVLFSGKTFLSPDAQAPVALSAPLQKMFYEENEVPLWLPHIFCGMPSFGSLIYTPLVYLPAAVFDAITRVVPLRIIVFHILHYLLAGMGTYCFLRRRGISFGPALLSGAAFMFMPYLITMEVFGHGSQMMTTAYMPFAMWAVDRLFDKRDLLSLGLAGLLIGLQFQRGHVQISYYILMTLGGYWIYTIIARWRAHRRQEILPLSLNFGAALGIAAMLAAILYLPLQEYTPYSIRGAQSILQESSGESGVGFDYATQWSFSPGEMMTFLLPSFFGFGGQSYWGNMPFTDYPNYMGIVVLILAITAIVWRRPLSGFFAIVALIALLISFGKHFSPLYRLLYEVLPYFNKFRVPVMILVLVQFSVAVLAGLGLEALLEKLRAADRSLEAKHRAIAKNLLLISGMVVFIALVASMARDGFAAMMQSIYPDRYEPQEQAQLDAARVAMLLGDLWMLALALGGSLALVALAFRKKIGPTALIIGLGILSLIDFWKVDFKINKPQSERGQGAFLSADQATLFLKSDSTLFRIFPTELFGENRWAAHGLQSIGGYHAAKPRAYQDFLEASGINNFSAKYFRRITSPAGRPAQEAVPLEEIPAKERQRHLWLLDLLNVKYILSVFPLHESNFSLRAQTQYDYHGQIIPLLIYENKNFLPRPYFVGRFEAMANPKEALDRLLSGDFNPRQSVILETTPGIAPEPDSTSSVRVVHYGLNDIDVHTQSRSPQILVLSDNYYPVGWSAYVDGQPTTTYRANFCFRAVAVPAGSHGVEFRMQSRGFSLGLWTTAAGALAVGGLLWIGWKREQSARSSGASKNPQSTQKEK